MGAVPPPPGLCQVFCGKGTRTPGHPHGGDMLRKREQDKKYRKDIRHWSEQCGRDNAQSHPGESSPQLGLHLDPSLQPRMSSLGGKLTGSGPSVSQQVARK